jgi:hypothetical protein
MDGEMICRRTQSRHPHRAQPRDLLSSSPQQQQQQQQRRRQRQRHQQLVVLLVLLQLLLVSASSTDCMLSSNPFLRGFSGHPSRQHRHPSRGRDASDFDVCIKRKNVEFGGVRRQTQATAVAAADLAMITCTPCMGGAPTFPAALAARGEIMGGRTEFVCGRAELRRRERGPRSFVGGAMEVAGISRLAGCSRLSAATTSGSMKVAGSKKLAGYTSLSGASKSGDFHPGDADASVVARAGLGWGGGGGSGVGDEGGDAGRNAGVSMDVGNLGNVGNAGNLDEDRVVMSPLEAYLISEVAPRPQILNPKPYTHHT